MTEDAEKRQALAAKNWAEVHVRLSDLNRKWIDERDVEILVAAFKAGAKYEYALVAPEVKRIADFAPELLKWATWATNHLGSIGYGLRLLARRPDIDGDVQTLAKAALDDLPR